MTKKYRPYFTLSELQFLRDCVASKPGISGSDLALYQYLDKYIGDITSGNRSASISLKPTISQSLGFSPQPESDIHVRDISTLHTIYQVNKSFIGMNAAEISAYQQFRFDNDMMTPEEEVSFVSSIMAQNPTAQSSS